MGCEILFATGNKPKLAQMQYIADYFDHDVTVVSAKEKFQVDYDEIGDSAKEIAINGVKELFSKIQQPILTEDSIIEIDVLNGKPGLKSNAFLKEHGREGILKLMEKENNRRARIVSVVAFFNGEDLKVFENIVEGNIAFDETFKQGEPFWIGPTDHPMGGGYNTIFIPLEIDRSLADMSAEEGITYGYREKNFKELLEFLNTKGS